MDTTTTITLSGAGSELQCTFNPSIDVGNKCQIGLLSLHTWNTIPNIDEDCNKFIFGSIDKPIMVITLPTGSYEFDDLQTRIVEKYNVQQHRINFDDPLLIDMLKENNINIDNINNSGNGEKKLNDRNEITFRADRNTMRTIIKCNHPIDFTHPQSIGRILGFLPRVLQPNIEHTSDFPLSITKVTCIRVDCNIIVGSYHGGRQSHTLHEFFPNVPPGYRIIECPRQVVYYPVNTSVLNTIRITLYDQDGRLLNIRGEKLTVRLHIKHDG